MTTGRDNVLVGLQAGQYNTTGVENTVVGYLAARNMAGGNYNTFMGWSAGYDNVGNRNTGLGYGAMFEYKQAGDGYNTAIGMYAMHQVETGSSNVAIGYTALRGATGNDMDYNIAIGAQALYSNTTGDENVAVGRNALFANTTGEHNVAVGTLAFDSNTTGVDNVVIGQNALSANNDNYNVVIGADAAQGATTMAASTLIGRQAGGGGGAITGDYNTSIGYQSGYAMAGAIEGSVFLGHRAGYGATSGGYNTFLGYAAGQNVTTGAGNVIIGKNAGPSSTNTDSNNLYIHNAAGTPLIYGEFDNSLVTINGNLSSHHLTPVADDTYTLGTPAKQWQELHISDIIYNKGYIHMADSTGLAGTNRIYASGANLYWNTQKLNDQDSTSIQEGSDWTGPSGGIFPITFVEDEAGRLLNTVSAATLAYFNYDVSNAKMTVRNATISSDLTVSTNFILGGVTVTDIKKGTDSASTSDADLVTAGYVNAHAGGGSGISWDGSTANGVATYKDADEATVESNLTFDGTDLLIGGTGKLKLSGSNNYIYASGDDTRIHATDTVVLDGDGKCMFRTPYLALETSAASEKFRFDIDNTKLGIGTNAPGENLHVVGTSRITGKAAFGGSTLPTNTGISVVDTIQIQEKSSAPTHVDTWGGLWVKNDDPTNLYFTDDDGNDIALTDNGAAAGGGAITATANGANNRIATYSAATALNGEANLTFDGTDLINTAGTLNGSSGACFEVIDVGQVTGDVNNVSRVGPIMVFATLPSDSRLKTNRSVFDYGLDEIKQLTPEYFNYSESAYNDTTLSKPDFTKKQIGLMADDVKAVMPELVETIPDTDYETYDKQGLVNVLINAVKELSNKNDALEARITELEGKL